MKVLSIVTVGFLFVFACGHKVDVEDSDHDLNVKAGICDVFDDKEEKQECVRKVLKALDDCEAE